MPFHATSVRILLLAAIATVAVVSSARAVTIHTSNTFAMRPQASVWINVSKRVGVNLTAGYVVARPQLSIRSSLGEENVRLRANVIAVSSGLVFKVF